jgi:hypothetical protein
MQAKVRTKAPIHLAHSSVTLLDLFLLVLLLRRRLGLLVLKALACRQWDHLATLALAVVQDNHLVPPKRAGHWGVGEWRVVSKMF